MYNYITVNTEMPTFMQFPKFLLDMEINETAKLLYMVLLDRARLSMVNKGWQDEYGRVYMVYLEILDRDKIADAAQRKHLIRQSLTKAQSIREMADKLFEYFLVYTSEWEKPDLELMDADEVMRQFWQEYAFSLESRGYTVRTDFGALNGRIMVNPALLQHAFDNLYANLLKYADAEAPIEIVIRREGGEARLRVTNTVSKARDQRQSTNIGLNTCQRILSMHSGSFECRENGALFEVRIGLPMKDG